MLVTILGLLGAAGLVGFYIPQIISIWRAPKLQGFSLFAWGCLLFGVSALLAQLVVLQAWTGVLANTIAVLVTCETLRQIVRKQS